VKFSSSLFIVHIETLFLIKHPHTDRNDRLLLCGQNKRLEKLLSPIHKIWFHSIRAPRFGADANDSIILLLLIHIKPSFWFYVFKLFYIFLRNDFPTYYLVIRNFCKSYTFSYKIYNMRYFFSRGKCNYCFFSLNIFKF
jgi:hypothetical protein